MLDLVNSICVSSLHQQLGGSVQGVANRTLQIDAVPPVPTVIFPIISVPATVGDVPQSEIAGVDPPMSKCPSAPRNVNILASEIVPELTRMPAFAPLTVIEPPVMSSKDDGVGVPTPTLPPCKIVSRSMSAAV